MASPLPTSKTATNRAKDLGPRTWHEYKDARERYKRQGLTAKEAYQRVYVEQRIGERWLDWRQRRTQQELMGGGNVPLTPKEMSEVNPRYKPLALTNAEEVGEEQMSHREVMDWAMKWAAKVENGEPSPTRFPNEKALFWYQSAIRDRSKFEQLLAKLSSPSGEGENLYLQDSQYRFSEIEDQLKDALREVGEGLVEVESGFVELIGQVTTVETA